MMHSAKKILSLPVRPGPGQILRCVRLGRATALLPRGAACYFSARDFARVLPIAMLELFRLERELTGWGATGECGLMYRSGLSG